MCYEIHIWTTPSPLQSFQQSCFFVKSQKAGNIADGLQTPTASPVFGVSSVTKGFQRKLRWGEQSHYSPTNV